MSTTSYMILTLPDVGVTVGPTWATYLNTALTTIDSHDHSSGKGTQITPGGMNINADLNFGGNNATNLKTTCFSNNAASLASTFQRCTYVANGDLYYNNGSGTTIQLTTGSSLNVSSVNGISGLAAPASASFSTPDFIFKSDATTYGKFNCGDIKLFPFSAGAANAVTLKSPTSLAASYSLTVPGALPGSTQYVSSDSSGNLSFVSADSIGSAMTSTGANAIVDDYTRTTGTSVGVRGVAISASCGSFSTTSTSFTAITNLSVTITTSGRPVEVFLMGDGSSNDSKVTVLSADFTRALAAIKILRDSTNISQNGLTLAIKDLDNTTDPVISIPPGSVRTLDSVSSGTYTYSVQCNVVDAATTFIASYCKLVAYEI